MKKPMWIAVAAALAVGLASGVAVDRVFAAQQQTGLTRKVLLTTDDPAAAADHQLVMAYVELAPGASSGKHRHPGIEIGYVLDGSIELQHEGQPGVTVSAGASFKNEGAHNGINHGTKPVKILAVYAVEKNKPLTEAVK